jgi:hypothetical protein
MAVGLVVHPAQSTQDLDLTLCTYGLLQMLL